MAMKSGYASFLSPHQITTLMSKILRYKELILKFKDHKFIDPDLINPHTLDTSFIDLKVLSPWELWHNDLDANVMLIGQDYSNIDYFLTKRDENGWVPDKTDQQIRKLFHNLNLGDIGLPSSKQEKPLFFTNAVLGMKKGTKSKGIKSKWYQETGEYLAELIAIVQPKYILTLGQTPYKAICHAHKIHAPQERIGDLIDRNGKHPKIGQSELFVVAHCSPLGQVTRPIKQQEQDWFKIGQIIAS